MTELDPVRRAIVERCVEALAPVPGLEAIALGGSWARGRGRPDSDVDLGLYYFEAAPFSIEAVRAVATRLDDRASVEMTGFYEWGPWVNGGGWLRVDAHRVDLLYRSFEHLERTIDACERGRHELHWGQQPPFGFFSATYLGELSIAAPLRDPHEHLARLKRRVEQYPEALREAIVQDYLWAVDFGLDGVAPTRAARGDVLGTVGCLARAAHQLVLVLFALNRVFPVNDKSALDEIEHFAVAPERFGERVTALLAHPGERGPELEASLASLRALFREVVDLAGPLYRAKRLP